MRSGLFKEATFVGGSLFVIGAALMQFDKKGITDKKYWPYLGVFILGFSGHLIFEAFGLNKKYCETAFGEESFEADYDWDEPAYAIDWRGDGNNNGLIYGIEYEDISTDNDWFATKDERDEALHSFLRGFEGWDAETFEATTNSNKNEIVPFSPQFVWVGKHFPLVDYSHACVISKIADGEVLKEPNSNVVNYPITRRDIEPITMKWGELFKLCKENNSKKIYTFSLGEGGQKYDTPFILSALKYLPKRTILTIYADHQYPLEVIFDYGGEKWVYRQRQTIEREEMSAETFNADSKEEARLKKYEKTYGKEGAKVRNRIFKRILANAQDGTKAGQWSARKAQSLTEDYEKAMKGKGKKPYKSSKKTKSQKDLKDWGDQDWTTKSGKKSSKTGERYLPKKAIKALSDKEYKETSDKKRKDTKKGKQFSKQPKKVADKVKKYRAEGELMWVGNIFNQNRYYCKRYEDVPYLQRKTFSGKNLRRGNRCYNCSSKECPSDLIQYKEKKRIEELERIAQEQKKKREQDWMENVVKPRKEEMERKRKKSKEMKLGFYDEDFTWDDFFWSAEGDIPYGVHVQNHKTTSTVFYKRKPFRKFRGNRHREQARAYAQYMENKLKKNPRHFSYWAEEFEAEGKPTEVEVKRSTNDEKKLMAIFTYPDGKTKTTHFGQRGASDYTKHGEKERMERYLERHGGGTTTSTKEDWQDPTTAGALSRWILWNKPSLSASFNDFKKRFNLKGELKVSKSAESFEANLSPIGKFPHSPCVVCETYDWDYTMWEEMPNGDIVCSDCEGEIYEDFLEESFEAQFTPSQEISDYTPEEIVESSAIEGFQPSKYSVISSSAEGEYSYALRTDFWFDDLRKALDMMQDTNNNDLIDYELNVDMIGIDGSGSYEMGYGESIDKVISDLMYYYSQERGQVKPFSQLTRGEVNYYPQGQYDGVGAINFNMKRINEEGAVVEVVFPSWSESSNALFFRTTPSFDAEGGHDGLNLVMMGVPGSGKGTQSKLITKKYGWPQIGMGDLIRDNMRRKTPLGLKCEPYMAKGSLVPDEIMIEMVSQRLKEDDCKNGFILDGFPRTVPQGKALEKITNIDAVIFLDTEKQIVIDRLGGRRTCSDCGEIFHLVFKPPKSEGKCDVCEGELFIRPDDNRKTILNRLKVFNQKTQPLIDFYEERNLLKVVESNSTPEEVFENIDVVIEELLGKETILASESQDTQYCDYHNQIVSGANLTQIMNAEHYTGDRPMTCPICIKTMSSYQTPSADV